MEIKFRGKSKLNGNWHYGSYLNFGDDWCQIITTKKYDDGIPYNSIRVISETVGQFTGLKDGNDIDIYIGDICSVYSGKKVIMNWDDLSFQLCLAFASKDSKTKSFFEFGQNPFEGVTIIGNIYDNPELLEVS